MTLYYFSDTVKPVPSWDKVSLTIIAVGPNGKECVNPCIMRTRTLVLTSESARHPFRQRLPAHVLRVAP
ncbi:MAG: hypothetical protein ABW164_01775, partial [Sphingobium sp.]